LKILVPLSVILLIIGLFLSQFMLSAMANPSIPPEIPPIVTISNMDLNATVLVRGNQLWASVDAEYDTSTIHGFGESYYLPNKYDSTVKVKYTVVTDRLEADYPIPLNATNINVKVNDETKEWYLKEKSIYHLYGSDIPRIGWVMQPTPRNFRVNVHYEHPLLKTGENERALILPLGQRYGSAGAPYYPLYDWFGQGKINGVIRLQIENSDFKVYSVFNDGSMNQLNCQNSVVTLTRTGNGQFPLGILVLTEASQSQKAFPFTVIIVASLLIIAGGGIGLVYYLRKQINRE
jgi:hypothetical protein